MLVRVKDYSITRPLGSWVDQFLQFLRENSNKCIEIMDQEIPAKHYNICEEYIKYGVDILRIDLFDIADGSVDNRAGYFYCSVCRSLLKIDANQHHCTCGSDNITVFKDTSPINRGLSACVENAFNESFGGFS